MGIAETFNMKIFASSEKRRVFSCLEDKGLSNRLTTDATSAQIHVVAMKEIATQVCLSFCFVFYFSMTEMLPSWCVSTINLQELHSYLNKYSPKFSNIVAFKPTGWTTSTSLKSKPSDFTKTSHGKVTIYGLCPA